jgi:hypothetical protein
MNRSIRLVTTLTLLAVGAARAQAQGMLRGQVLDAGGAPLAGALVTATGPQGPQSAISNRDGYYMIAGLVGGEYTVRTRMAGYPSTLLLQIRIAGSRPFELDCELASDTETYRVRNTPIETRNATPVVRVELKEPRGVRS